MYLSLLVLVFMSGLPAVKKNDELIKVRWSPIKIFKGLPIKGIKNKRLVIHRSIFPEKLGSGDAIKRWDPSRL